MQDGPRTQRAAGDPLQDLDRAPRPGGRRSLQWRVELLEAIKRLRGSLSHAAEALAVPYRTAWERVKATEGEVVLRLLDSESGGPDGGGSRLTPQARDLCRRFRRVSSGIQEVVSRRFAAEFGNGSEGA